METLQFVKWVILHLFIFRIVYGLKKQEGILENFRNFFPFQELITAINDDLYADIIYDCSLLDLDNEQCIQDCQYYNNISALYIYLNNNSNNNINFQSDPLLINISSWYATSSSSFNYFDVGNPLQCEYYYGTYCYTPITVKSDLTLYQHGCCIPGSCTGNDAEKVLINNAFCFQSFNKTIYNKVYKNNNVSIFGYSLDTTLNIKCSSSDDRDFNQFGIYLVFGIFVIFLIFICVASGVRYHVGPTPTDFDVIADNMSNQDSFCAYYVNIFAIQDNFNKLLNRRNILTFEYLDGVRVWSFFWIVICAALQMYFITGVSDFDAVLPITFIKGGNNRENWSEYITQSFLIIFVVQFAMDTFFWLSGFLGVLSLHKIIRRQQLYHLDDNGGCLESVCSWCRFSCCKMITFSINSWIRRYLRLIPMILYVMLITAYLLDQVPTGYHVVSRDVYKDCCSQTFWQNILLIRNLIRYTYEDMPCLFGCMNHIWYVCCDFQLFLLLPFLVYIYNQYHKIAAMIITFILVIIGIGVRGFLGFYFEFSANLLFDTNEAINDGDQIYMSYNKPWSRICPYYFGVLTMMIIIYIDEYYNDSSPLNPVNNEYYSKTQNWRQFSLKLWQYILLQSIAVAIIAAILVVPYDNIKNQPKDYWNVWQNAVYYALSGPLWGLSISFFVFALKFRPLKHDNYSQMNDNIHNDHKSTLSDDSGANAQSSSFIVEILSGPTYEILSKLTYTMYLIHFFILKWWSMTLSQPLYFNLFDVINLFIATWVISAIFSLILWLIIQQPMANLIEFMLGWCKDKEHIYQLKLENANIRAENSRSKRRRRRGGAGNNSNNKQKLVSNDSANYMSLELQNQASL